MDTIGLSAIPLLSARLRSSIVGQQSWTAKLLFKMAMALLISRHCALRERPHGIILYAFDLLHLDVKDLRQQTLIERRASLKVIVIGNRCPGRDVLDPGGAECMLPAEVQ
jgi:hypothetical protein